MLGNTEKIDKSTLLFLVPTLAIFTGVMFFLFLVDGQWTVGRIVFISVFSLVTALLLITLINQEKFWWAPRLLALLFLVVVMGGAAFAFLFDLQLEKKEFLAMVISFLVLGVPSALFLLWGSTGGKDSSSEPGVPLSRRERLEFLSVRTAKSLVLIASVVLGLLLAFEMLR